MSDTTERDAGRYRAIRDVFVRNAVLEVDTEDTVRASVYIQRRVNRAFSARNMLERLFDETVDGMEAP